MKWWWAGGGGGGGPWWWNSTDAASSLLSNEVNSLGSRSELVPSSSAIN